MKYLNPLVILLALAFSIPIIKADAQNYLLPRPNLGLEMGPPRIDDIYFVNRSTGFVATEHSYIQKTTDSAKSWVTKLHSTGSYFRSIEFSDDGKFGVAGTLTGGKFFRSDDSGESWTDIGTSIPDTGVNRVQVCGLSHYGNNFYGVGWWGSKIARLYKSTDSGITWNVKYMDTTLVTGLVDILSISANTIIATGCRFYDSTKRESVVLRSDDTGNTWTKVFSDTTIGGRVWKVQFLDTSLGYGAIEPFFPLDTICYIKTTDGGKTWNMHSIGKPLVTYPAKNTQGIGFITPAIGFIGGWHYGHFTTTDSGKTWKNVAHGENFNRFFRIDSTYMYAAGGVVYGYENKPNTRIKRVLEPACSHTLYPVSPNPAKSTVRISFDIKYRTNVLLEVVEIANRNIYPVFRGQLQPGHYEYDWNGANAANGNYFVWLGTDEIPLAQKFVLRK